MAEDLYKKGGEQDHTSNPYPSGFGESTITVGSDYRMPRAGKTKDYMTPADRKANPNIK